MISCIGLTMKADDGMETGKLADTVIPDFTKWVAVGAPDSREKDAVEGTYAQIHPGGHWAFQPVKAALIPDVRNAAWPRREMDRFVLARLESRGMQPARPADRRTLIRRASYDLIGLPPRPAQVDAFVLNDDPSALARVVDELLDSPHFGGHWARFWLDNVRYTQDDYTCCAFSTNDFDSTPYRDWVVRALNADLPYDEFVRLQIAGDLIPHKNPDQVNTDGLTATGVWTFSHIIADNDPDKVIVDFVDQQIDVLGRTFLGLTIACARCHDHKFDPITQRDYYGLAGIFLSSHSLTRAHPETGDTTRTRAAYRVLVPILSTRREMQQHARRLTEIEHCQTELQQLKRQHAAAFELRRVRRRIKQQMERNVQGDADRQNRDSTIARFKKQQARLLAKIDPGFLKQQVEAVYAQHDQLAEKLKQLQEPLGKLPRRPAMLEGGSPGTRFGGKISDVPVFIRGNHTRLGDLVPRAFPSVLCWQDEPPIASRTTGSGRLELAAWLVDQRHPLTARVMVNRVWQQLFGWGIVRTPSNFGLLGARPTHPRLLDYLAARFIESGWSLKDLLRELMLSSTYGQDSRVAKKHGQQDAENLLFGRMNRKRLTGEQLRDTLQMLAGTVRHEVSADQLPNSGRALYLKVTRFQQPDDLLMQFDVPDPSLVVPHRSDSTAATQALFMLNNPLVLEAARLWAGRLTEEITEKNDRILRAFRDAYGRLPTAAECKVATETLASSRQQWLGVMTDGSQDAPKDAAECEVRAWQDFCHVLLCGNEFVYVD